MEAERLSWPGSRDILHDIGNVINRIDHAQSGAVMAFRILDNLGRTQTSFHYYQRYRQP